MRAGRQSHVSMGCLGWILLGWLVLPLTLIGWTLIGLWRLLVGLYRLARLAVARAVLAWRKARTA